MRTCMRTGAHWTGKHARYHRSIREEGADAYEKQDLEKVKVICAPEHPGPGIMPETRQTVHLNLHNAPGARWLGVTAATLPPKLRRVSERLPGRMRRRRERGHTLTTRGACVGRGRRPIVV